MTTYIGLLRAVNLAGFNKVGMADLRDLMAGIGLKDAQTLLQSGNVVFKSEGGAAAQLERQLEAAVAKRLKVETDFFLRTAKEWDAVIADNPFPKEATVDPGHLLAVFLRNAADAKAVADLQKAIVGREVVRAKGRTAYIVYPDGVGRSKLTSALIEKKLGTRGTARNWNTVLKLGALAGV
jgi:uncharacterized protein (DUF1697 family)